MKPPVPWFIGPVLVLVIFMFRPAGAAPFTGVNLAPFALVRQPGAFVGPVTLADGIGAAGIDLALGNNFSVSGAAGESIVLDGESVRLLLSYRYGLGHGLEAGIELPWISHSGGGLDAFIEDWHEFWGMPDGGRPRRGRNRLEYRYRRDGVDRVALLDRAAGPGDLRLTGAWQFAGREGGPAGCLRASLSLPGGDPDRLLGSGGLGLALWLSGATRTGSGTGLFARAGVLVMGPGEVLEDIRRDLAFFAGVGFRRRLLPRMEGFVQADFSTPRYRSDLVELGADSGRLSFGGGYRLDRGLMFRLGMSEDILVNTAPDVTFFLALTGRGGGCPGD